MDRESIINYLKINNEEVVNPHEKITARELLKNTLINFNPKKYKNITENFTKKDWAQEIYWRVWRFEFCELFVTLFYEKSRDSNWEKNAENIYNSPLAFMGIKPMSEAVVNILMSFRDVKQKNIHDITMYDVWLLKHYLDDSYNSIYISENMENVIEKNNTTIKYYELIKELSSKNINDISLNSAMLSRLNMTDINIAAIDMRANALKTKLIKLNINLPKKILMDEFEDWLDSQQQNENIKFTAYKFTDNEFLKWKRMNFLAAIDLYIINYLLSTIIKDFCVTEREFLEILGVKDFDNRIPDEYDKYEKLLKKINEGSFIQSLLSVIE